EQDDFTVGVQFSLPIFEGASRVAEVRLQKAQVRQLSATREQALQQLETNAISAFHSVEAAHPNIRLSRVSLRAAEKNYESVREKYSQGAATILDLLDSQDQLLSQKQESKTAVYAYLDAIFILQRSIAWFEYEKPAAEQKQLEDLITAFLRGAVPMEHPATSPTELEAERAQNQAFSVQAEAESENVVPSREKSRKPLRSLFKNRKHSEP
ncbi:MAG: TolC family protein, partial [Verrucomicrobiota bacterium]